jgi:hypothetical protein
MFPVKGGSFRSVLTGPTRKECNKMDSAKITFFMLVTNRDALIADYCVKSYQSLHNKFKDEIPFVLYIYCNCLDDATKQKYVPQWSAIDCVEIFDNLYYEGVDSRGEKLVFDSSGYFQHRLITDFGYRFAAVEPKFCRDFIHYGAFSKNRSINDSNIGLYRRLAILRRNGLQMPFEDHAAVKLLNKLIRAGARLFIRTYFSESERTRYDFSKD